MSTYVIEIHTDFFYFALLTEPVSSVFQDEPQIYINQKASDFGPKKLRSTVENKVMLFDCVQTVVEIHSVAGEIQ